MYCFEQVTLRRLTDNTSYVEWSVGVVFVNILGCHNVIATHDSSAVTYVQVSVGGETKQTRTRVGSSPVFNTGFHFLIRYGITTCTSYGCRIRLNGILCNENQKYNDPLS